MLEKPVEDYLKKEVIKLLPNARVVKFEAERNDPDRLCLLPGGRAVFIELKRPKKGLRDGQQRAIDRLTKLGFEAFMVNSTEGVDDFINKLRIEYKLI